MRETLRLPKAPQDRLLPPDAVQGETITCAGHGGIFVDQLVNAVVSDTGTDEGRILERAAFENGFNPAEVPEHVGSIAAVHEEAGRKCPEMASGGHWPIRFQLPIRYPKE